MKLCIFFVPNQDKRPPPTPRRTIASVGQIAVKFEYCVIRQPGLSNAKDSQLIEEQNGFNLGPVIVNAMSIRNREFNFYTRGTHL